ncbi:MAG: flippase [Candidatus Ozemobacteraceae bacterium]
MLKRWISQNVEERPRIIKIIGNTWWLFFDQIVRMCVGLLVGVWVARYLGPERYGILNYSLALASLFGAVATLGLDTFVIQDIIKTPDRKNDILGTAFYLKLLAGIATYLFAIISILILKPRAEDQLYRYLIYIISAGVIFQSLDVIDCYFQSQTKSKYTVWAKTSMLLLISIARLILIHTNASLVFFAWASLLELVINGLALLYVYQKSEKQLFHWKFDKGIAQGLLIQSWPYYIAYIAAFIYMKIGQIMIGNMLGDKQAGLFAASARLYELPFVVIMVFTSSVFPTLVDYYERDRELFYRRYSQITYVYTILGYLVLAFVWLFGPFLINLFFGKEYADAFPILSIHMVGMFIHFNAGLRSSYITLSSNQKIILITTVISAVMNVALNYLLIPRYNAAGAAISTVITQFVALFLSNIFFAGTKEIFTIQLRSLLLIPSFSRSIRK